MLSEETLKQAAAELAHALNESLPKPEQCQHQFSEKFEAKVWALLSPLPTPPDDGKTKIPSCRTFIEEYNYRTSSSSDLAKHQVALKTFDKFSF